VDDSEYEDDPVVLDDVKRHPIVAHAQTVERIRDAADGLHTLATDPTGLRGVICEAFERLAKPNPDRGR
jgi:hypothetical protein